MNSQKNYQSGFCKGHGKSIIDCDTLDRYREPPSSVYSWGGNHPKVCCPDPVGLCFPGEPCSDNPKVYEDYEYEGGDYDYNPSIVFDGEGICQNGTSCTEISSCGAADFVGNSSPSYCGRTEDGQDKICCKGQGGSPKIPQPALFLDKKKQIYECLDQTEFCEKWLRLNPQSCSSGHPSYPFMREACYKTCNRCGSDVIYFKFALIFM